MKKINPRNERVKHEYFDYLRHAKKRTESTINGVCAALARFEEYTGGKDFAYFNKDQAMAFNRHLTGAKTAKGHNSLSIPTMLSTTNALKNFFIWLSQKDGFKKKIKLPDIEYLNMSQNDERIARAPKVKKFPKIEQVRQAIFSMPDKTDIDRRNRALVALTILTGMRVSALVSLRLKHIHLDREPVLIGQQPDQVNTKFRKAIFSYLLPIGEDIQDIFLNWINELRVDKNYGDEDPVFPKTRMLQDENLSLTAKVLEPVCWATSSPVREIFKYAFAGAVLPYYHPHSFRHTLAHMIADRHITPAQLKAWSQNLGHEHIATTMVSYCKIDPETQGQILKDMNLADKPQGGQDVLQEIRRLLATTGS